MEGAPATAQYLTESSSAPNPSSMCPPLSCISCSKSLHRATPPPFAPAPLGSLHNELGQYTSYSQPFLLTQQDAGMLPNLLGLNPSFIGIFLKSQWEGKNIFLDSSTAMATGRGWWVMPGICHMTDQMWTLLFLRLAWQPSPSITAIRASAWG